MVFVLLALAVVLAAKPVSAEAMVDLGAVAPGVRRDMRYATVDNFLKRRFTPRRAVYCAPGSRASGQGTKSTGRCGIWPAGLGLLPAAYGAKADVGTSPR